MPRRLRSYTGRRWISCPIARMAPAWNVVWPMIVARSVVLPTPLRPSTASEPRSGTSSATSSRITVSPYPARSPCRRSASAMRLAQVHGAHAAIGRDLVGAALDQHLSLHQHRDAIGEAEHQIHVVLDDEDRDIAGQRTEDFEDAAGILRRHARRRLVEQQDARVESQRDGDLHKALPFVRQVLHARARVILELERGEELER